MHYENNDKSYEVYIQTPEGEYVLSKDSFNAFKVYNNYYKNYSLDILDLIDAVIIMNEVLKW